MATQQVLNVKRGDTAPYFRARCLDGTDPVDLSTATQVRFLMSAFGGANVITASMTVEDQEGNPGWVRRNWQPTDLATGGYYHAEVEVTWNDGKVQTFPAEGYVAVNIIDDLG
jgi:hypothetical protein